MAQNRKDVIEHLLKCLAGLEISIGLALEGNDDVMFKELKQMRQDYYEKLRKVIYGKED